MKKREVTKESIQKVMEDNKPGTMTALAHALGYKGSVSGNVTKKIRKLVPGIDKALRMNAAAAEIVDSGRKKTSKKRKKAKEHPRPEISPFRRKTLYGAIWNALFACRERGITRDQLLDYLKRHPDKAISSRSEKCHRWAIIVVSSSRETGEAHRSISGKHADIYWVEKLGGRGERLKLHLRKQKYTTS